MLNLFRILLFWGQVLHLTPTFIIEPKKLLFAGPGDPVLRFFQIRAGDVLFQRGINYDRNYQGNDELRAHVPAVVRGGIGNRRHAVQEAKNEGHHDAGEHRAAVVLLRPVEDPGKAYDQIGDYVIQQYAAYHHADPARCRIADVVQTEDELQKAVNEGAQYAPFPFPAEAEQYYRQHAADGKTAAHGHVDLKDA